MIVPGSICRKMGFGLGKGEDAGCKEEIRTMRTLVRTMARLLKKTHA